MSATDPLVTGLHVWSHPASPRSTWVMVRVSAGDLAGVGELSDGGAAATLVTTTKSLSDLVVGRRVGSARSAVRDLLQGRRAASNSAGEAFFWSTVLGGMESAFADLAARGQGVPLATALGLGTPLPVRAYANLNRRWGGQSADVLCEEARRAALAGYAAVKIAPFSWARQQGATHDGFGRGLDLVARVSDALPPGTGLMVDCHHLVPDDLIGDVVRELATADLLWVEDLVDVVSPAALQSAASLTDLPLAAGEHVWDPIVAEKACASGALAYWLVDPKHAGGPVGTARIAEAVDGATLTFHNPSGPVGTAHAAHLAGLAEGDTWLEVAWGEVDRATYLHPPERVLDGTWVPGQGSGIGTQPAPRVTSGAQS